jgi:hypothetical protein
MLDGIARNLIQTGRLLKHMEPKKEKAKKENEQEQNPEKPKRQRIKK